MASSRALIGSKVASGDALLVVVTGSPFSGIFPSFGRFTSVRASSGGAGHGVGIGIGLNEVGFEGGGGFLEEYVLEDLELSPADLGE